MIYRYSHILLIRLAGLIVWFSLSVPIFLQLESWNSLNFIGYLLAHLSFGLLFLAITLDIDKLRLGLRAWLSITLLIALVLFINHLTNSAIGVIYALIIAVLLPWFFNLRNCVLVWLTYNSLLAVQFRFIGDDGLGQMVQYVLFAVYLAASAFSFIISLIAFRQKNAKEEFRRLNTELRATQVLLEDSSRINERLRISRDLHDLIGHHLTALTMNLEAASHMTEGKPKDYVQKAHSIARLLLADVREVVSQFRQSESLDLSSAIAELLDDLPVLKVNKEIADDFMIEDPKMAQTILRCLQELITNCLKHAKAKTLTVKLERNNNEVLLFVKDDGIGLGNSKQGNGLLGLKERVKMLNGKVNFTDKQGAEISLTIPIHQTNTY